MEPYLDPAESERDVQAWRADVSIAGRRLLPIGLCAPCSGA